MLLIWNALISQEILAYRERVKALAMKLEQFDGISSIVEELQRKVSSQTSQHHRKLRIFARMIYPFVFYAHTYSGSAV